MSGHLKHQKSTFSMFKIKIRINVKDKLILIPYLYTNIN